SFEVVTPVFESADNGQKFFVVGIVVPLWGRERVRDVCNGVPVVVEALLREDGSDGVVRGVTLYMVGFVRIGHEKYRRRRKGLFHLIKCSLLGIVPTPVDRLLEVFYKTPVEVGKTDERLNFLDIARTWPVHDTCDLDRVH
ncbi:hypothetical protein PENSPDRAFT_595923, partial [Peniophora sp. CONT]